MLVILKVVLLNADENQLHAAVVELVALDSAELNILRFKIGTLVIRMVRVAYLIL